MRTRSRSKTKSRNIPPNKYIQTISGTPEDIMMLLSPEDHSFAHKDESKEEKQGYCSAFDDLREGLCFICVGASLFAVFG
jgi:hypothetical protein